MFKLYPRQILNSRGEPTLEVKLITDSFLVEASVPGGKSVSTKEAQPLRDKKEAYDGLTVEESIEKINTIIAPAIESMDLSRPLEIDEKMLSLDPTLKKTKLGANSLLAVSLAVYKAASITLRLPLYRLISQLAGTKINLPTPLINIINGGLHSHQTTEFQEYHLIPNFPNKPFAFLLSQSWLVLQNLIQLVNQEKKQWGYGDEGGISCLFNSNAEPFQLLKKAVQGAGFSLGTDFYFGLDAAANNFYRQGKYSLREKKTTLSSQELLNYYQELITSFPLQVIEDPFAEEDSTGWKLSQKLLDKKAIIVADDLTSTNPYLFPKIEESASFDSVLIKPNQIGTIKETLQFAKMAKAKKKNLIVSHRSGETCDPFIADLAVGLGSKFVKFGNIRQGERVVKYNRLLEIASELTND